MLAALGGSLAAAHTLMNQDDVWQPAERSFVDTFLHSILSPRGATQCGPAYNNQVCDAGQCCSADGQCGTGETYCAAPSCQFQWGPACDANQTPPGTNTTSLPRPKFGSVPYGSNIYHCNTPGKVALTFDDGPYLYTADLLDLLKTNNVKATFFMVGNNNGKGQIELDSTGWPAIMRRVFNEGHQIGSHTWSHQSLDSLTPQQVTDQVIKNEIAFSDVFGFFPTYLRPPYGFCSGSTCLSTLGNLGYHVVNWDVDTLDWQENYENSRNIFSAAIKSSNPSTNSFLPLTHDVHYGTVHGFVQFMLDTLHAAGYTTALLGDCLNDPRENWYRDATTGQRWTSSATVQAATTSSITQQSTSSSAPASTTSSSQASSSSSASTSAAQLSASPAASTGQSSASSSSTASDGTSSYSASSAAGCTAVGACIVQGLSPTTVTNTAAAFQSKATSTTSTSATAKPTLVTTNSGARFGPQALHLSFYSVVLLGLLSMG